MDRILVYPGSIPLDTDILNTNRNSMIALGYLAQAVLGTNTVVDGLACSPTAPASMTVTVGPGSIAQLSVVDILAYGSLPADTTDPLVKLGINLTATSFTLAAPSNLRSSNQLFDPGCAAGERYRSDCAPLLQRSQPGTAVQRTNQFRYRAEHLPYSAGATPAQGGCRRKFRLTVHPADRQWLGRAVRRHSVVRSDGDRRGKYCAVAHRTVSHVEAPRAATRVRFGRADLRQQRQLYGPGGRQPGGSRTLGRRIGKLRLDQQYPERWRLRWWLCTQTHHRARWRVRRSR